MSVFAHILTQIVSIADSTIESVSVFNGVNRALSSTCTKRSAAYCVHVPWNSIDTFVN